MIRKLSQWAWSLIPHKCRWSHPDKTGMKQCRKCPARVAVKRRKQKTEGES